MRTSLDEGRYISDLADSQWQRLEPLIPPASLEGRPPMHAPVG